METGAISTILSRGGVAGRRCDPDSCLERTLMTIAIRTLALAQACLIFLLCGNAALADSRDVMVSGIDARFDEHKQIALKIWDLAELGIPGSGKQRFAEHGVIREGFSSA